MPDYSKNIVYLSKTQYSELVANGSITVDGVTVTYDENDIYVTPQEEPVTDVTVDGTSIVTDGVATIPVASNEKFGVMKISSSFGHAITNGILVHKPAADDTLKRGADQYDPVVAKNQHASTFYGLAKSAGDTTQSQSDNAVGQYTDEAKGAIQSMLGVSGLMAPEENDLVASRAYAIGDVFTANGKLYKATAAIAVDGAILLPGSVGENCEAVTVADEFVKFTDYASSSNSGIVRILGGGGLSVNSTGVIAIDAAPVNNIKTGSSGFHPIVPSRQHASTFYGLAKAAGDTTQSASDNAVGTYTDTAKSAICSMIGANEAIEVVRLV